MKDWYFHSHELLRLYNGLMEEHYEEMISDLIKLCKALQGKDVEEWRISLEMLNRFPTEDGEYWSIKLKASRSSMAVEYSVKYLWPNEYITLTRKEIGKLDKTFQIAPNKANIVNYQEWALFGSWLQRLIQDYEYQYGEI
jgi:hypothetical protein